MNRNLQTKTIKTALFYKSVIFHFKQVLKEKCQL